MQSVWKKCKICHQVFGEQSASGNPYKWCPNCRSSRHDEMVRYAASLKLEGVTKK